MSAPAAKPTVCILTTSHNVKDDRIFHKEALSLERFGYEVIIVAQHCKEEIIDSIRVFPLRPAKRRFDRHVRSVFRAFWLAMRLRADVYHFHDPELLPVGLMLRILGKKVIYDAHEDYQQKLKSKQLPRGIKTLLPMLWRIWERFVSRRMSHNIVADSHTLTLFPRKKTTVISNFVPLHFSEVHQREDHDDRFRIMYVGGISVDRGIAKVIEAMDRLNVPNAELHLAGRILDPELTEVIAKHPRVVYHGILPWEKVNELLVAGHLGLVLLQPVPAYLYCPGENCVKLFEYMALGLPVLISDFPKLKAFIESVGAGMAVNPTSPAKIAEALRFLYENPAERQRMGENGQQAVRDRFCWEREEEKLRDVYRKVLTDGTPVCPKERGTAS